MAQACTTNTNICQGHEITCEDLQELSHLRSMALQMNNFRDTNTMCDVTIVVQDRTFPAHKYILAAASGYFRAMFTVDCKEKNEAKVCILLRYNYDSGTTFIQICFCWFLATHYFVLVFNTFFSAVKSLWLFACCSWIASQLVTLIISVAP